MRKFPPKGYRNDEYPLPHNGGFSFGLSSENVARDSTIIRFFGMNEQFINPEAVHVNPGNALFAEEGGSAICRGSIIPRLNLTFHINMTKGAIETDKMRAIKVQFMPIYTAFLDSLDAIDEKTGEDIESIIEMQHDVTDKCAFPLYSGTKLQNTAPIVMNSRAFTEVFGVVGLTTNNTPESVAFDSEKFYDALQYYSNAGKMKAHIGRMRTVVVTRDRPFQYHSNNFTFPTVKRGNPYMFCGMLYHVPAGIDQFYTAGDTTDIDAVHIKGRYRYDEWNTAFEQATI